MQDALTFAFEVGEVACINVMLSVDNAIVIALACSALPEGQRRLAFLVGGLGAVTARVAFTLLVASVLRLPFLRLAGGLFVVYLAVGLSRRSEGPRAIAARPTVSSAVRSMIAADLLISLDNALALGVVARSSPSLIVFGLLVSAPLVMFCARVLLSTMNRLPALVWVGAVALGWAGGALIAGDPAWRRLDLTSPPERWTSAAAAAFVLGAIALRRRFAKA